MDDRVYPSSKPLNPPPQNGAANGAPSFPPSKAQLYGATRPPYRPQPKPRHRHRRGCCCRCCLWTTLLLLILIFLVALAGVVFWVIYRPHRPSFSVKSLKITHFNITTPKNSSPILNSKLDLTVSAHNPNNKIVFLYDPISVSIKSASTGVDIGTGSFPAFTHSKKNTTSIKALLSSGAQDLDSDTVKTLNSDLKKKNGVPVEIELETKVKVKIGSIKTKKVRIRVNCKGFEVTAPNGKSSPSTMKASKDAKCKVNLKIKIWKWTT